MLAEVFDFGLNNFVDSREISLRDFDVDSTVAVSSLLTTDLIPA